MLRLHAVLGMKGLRIYERKELTIEGPCLYSPKPKPCILKVTLMVPFKVKYPSRVLVPGRMVQWYVSRLGGLGFKIQDLLFGGDC